MRGRPASDWCARRSCSAAESRGAGSRSWALVRAGARWSLVVLRGGKSLLRGRLVALIDLVAPDPHEVEETGECGERHGGERDRLGGTLPESDERTDVRVRRESRVQLRLIGMMEHVHHVRASHAGRIVQTRVVEAA